MLKQTYVAQLAQYDSAFNAFYNICDKSRAIMDQCYYNEAAMAARIGGGRTNTGNTGEQESQPSTTPTSADDLAATYRAAYENLGNCYLGDGSGSVGLYELQEQLQIATINDKIDEANSRMSTAKPSSAIMSAPSNLWKTRARRLTRRSPINRRQWTNSPARLPQLKQSNLRKKPLKT